MGNYFKFLYKQGMHNIKRSFLILIGISLSIAVMSGINIYINSAQVGYLNSQLYTLSDLYVGYTDDNLDYQGAKFHVKYDDIEEIYWGSGIDFAGFYAYDSIDIPQLGIIKNYSDVLESDRIPGLEELEYLNVYLQIFDYSFYSSYRFNEFFNIVLGTAPSNPNEMMVDYATYQRLNLTVGEETTLDLKFYRSRDGYRGTDTKPSRYYPLYDYNWTDVVISGIYVPLKPSFRFIDQTYNSSISNYDFSKLNQIPLLDQHNLPVFTGYDMNESAVGNDHFFIDFMDRLVSEITSGSYTGKNLIEQHFGVMAEYDRATIGTGQIYSTKQNLENAYIYIHYQVYSGTNPVSIRRSSTVVVQPLFSKLDQVQTRFESIKTEFQIINIPIFIFAIIIGNLGFKTKIRGRNEEFLLFRSKGMSTWRINLLIISETIFNALFIFIIGMAGGLGFFNLFKHFLTDYLNLSGELLTLLSPPASSYAVTLGFSLGISFLSSLSVFTYVNRMTSDKILKSIGSDDMDALYDEKTLFGGKTIQEEEEFDKMLKRVNPMKALKMQKYYEDKVKIKENKVGVSSIIFIVVGVLPFIPFIIIGLANSPLQNDFLIKIRDYIQELGFVFESLLLISPIFIVIGVIKAVILDKPSRFARLGKFLSKPFLNIKSFICGMELVRRKQFRYLVLIMSLFSSILMYTNLYTTTSINQEVIKRNFNVGADILIEPRPFGNNIDNMRDTEVYKDHMISTFANNTDMIIDDVLFVYYEFAYIEEIDDNVNIYYTDLEKYYEFITEPGKYHVSSGFRSVMKDLINQNNQVNENVTPSVIANQVFYDTVGVNPGLSYDMNISHEFYYYENETNPIEYVMASLDYTYELFPGLFNPYEDGTEIPCLLMDTDFVTHTNWSLVSPNLFVMLDVDYQNFDFSEIDIEEQINNASYGYIVYGDFKFYDNQWNDLKFRMQNSGIEKFFGIVHFETILVGLLMSFGLAITLLAYQEDNKYFNGILLSRGFGKQGIMKLIFSEMMVLFSIAFVGGGFFSMILALLTIALKPVLYPEIVNLSFNAFFDPLTLFGLYGLICFLSYALYYVSFKINARKSITRYFHKF